MVPQVLGEIDFGHPTGPNLPLEGVAVGEGGFQAVQHIRHVRLQAGSVPKMGRSTTSGKPTGPTAGQRDNGRGRVAGRIFEIDPLECPRCGQQMRTVAFITEPRVIGAFLEAEMTRLVELPLFSRQLGACAFKLREHASFRS